MVPQRAELHLRIHLALILNICVASIIDSSGGRHIVLPITFSNLAADIVIIVVGTTAVRDHHSLLLSPNDHMGASLLKISCTVEILAGQKLLSLPLPV